MSNNKKYNPVEVAKMVADRLRECLQKHELGVEDLKKSSNSSHEIDAGEEPNNDDAQCPKSLGGAGASESSESSEYSEDAEYSEDSEDSKKKSAEYSEDSEEEDEPLNSEDYEVKDEDSEESDDEEEDEPDEKDYEFKKSEAGMHTITYRSLKKNDKTSKNISIKRLEPGEEEMSDEGAKEVKRTSQRPEKTNKVNQDYHKQKGNWRRRKAKETGNDKYLMGHHDDEYGKAEKSESKKKVLEKCKGVDNCDCECESPKDELEKNTDQKVRETKGKDFQDEPHKSDKDKENFKRPMEKCGDMVDAKKYETYYLEQLKKLEGYNMSGASNKDTPNKFGTGYNMSGASTQGTKSQPSQAPARGGAIAPTKKPAFSQSRGQKEQAQSQSALTGDAGLSPGIKAKRSQDQEVKGSRQQNEFNRGATKAFNKEKYGADYKNTLSGSKTPSKEGGMSTGKPASFPKKEQAQAPKSFVYDKAKTKFGAAFKEARAGGAKEFEWGGKKYHTKHKEEMGNKEQAPARKESISSRLNPDNQFKRMNPKLQNATRNAYRNADKQGPSLRDRLSGIKNRRMESRQQQVNRVTGSGPRFMKSEEKLAKFVEKQSDLNKK